jgi:hypothetical protein
MSNKRILLALSLVLLSGCATLQKPAESWEEFFSAVPGKEIGGGSPAKAGRWKEFPFQIEHGSSQVNGIENSFSGTCKHFGGSIATLQSSGQAQEFSKAISAWRNGETASFGTLSYSRHIVCEDRKTNTVIAAVVFYQDRGSRYAPYNPKNWHTPVIAFYRTGNISEFVGYYMAEERKRVDKTLESLRQKRESESERTQQLRTSPKVGDETSKGVIVELRPPLALIQYHPRIREILNLPTSEWVPISSLTAPSF